MSKFCGLCSSSPYQSLPNKQSKPRSESKRAEKTAYQNGPIAIHPLFRSASASQRESQPQSQTATSILRRKSADFEWAREDQLSVILEIDSTRNTPSWEKSEAAAWGNIDSVIGGQGKDKNSWQLQSNWPSKFPGYRSVRFKETGLRIGRIEEKDFLELRRKDSWESLGSRGSQEFLLGMEEVRLRPIAAPPRDLESIARIDKSLVFEHFTTEDAWLLGSALRNRLLPIPIPVVINISLANQNQTLFHTCTHSGVMPDNDSWVARKRKTVLRWGVSTWYMSCKFGGDEVAFRDKYGLGNSAGEYAIHGGGVPIRVTGVEGVVAVVVVSGLKQDEDHAVVVEVIRELYY